MQKEGDWAASLHVLCCSLSFSPGRKSEEENLFEIITADEVHYFLQAATAKERTEWIKAIQVASRTGKWGCFCSPSSLSQGNPVDKLGLGPVHFWQQTDDKGLRAGKFLSAVVLNRTNHMPRPVHLHQSHCFLKPLCVPPRRYNKLCGMASLLNLSRPELKNQKPCDSNTHGSEVCLVVRLVSLLGSVLAFRTWDILLFKTVPNLHLKD